jgi:hypothetical protein
MNRFVTCSYCLAKNPLSEKNCVACGAPLPELAASVPPTQVNSTPPAQKIDKDKTVEIAHKVAVVYGNFWQSVMEAIVIAAVGFGIGFTGALINHPVAGVLGAAIVGLCVGLTIKYSIFTLFSTPLGLLIGSLLSITAAVLKLPPISYVILMTLGASLGAVLGGMPIPFRFRSVWHKLRPLVGTVGGLFFGLLGSLLGTGIHLVYTNWF